MNRTTSFALGAAATAALVAATLPAVTTAAFSSATTAAATPTARAKTPVAFGLTARGDLVRFRTDDPEGVRRVAAIEGLELDQRVVGIDFRPADGRLYAVGNRGGIYTVALRTGRATRVSQLTVPLDGRAFGVDFNPAVDRLRVVSDTGQNLRHEVSPTGTTIVDGQLNTPPSTEPTTGVTAAAYTNNDNDPATGATLYDISTALDQVLSQVPANSGTLNLQGPLGVDAGRDAGLDVHSARRGNTAFATLAVKGERRLYRVALLSGKVTKVGSFERTRVVDLSVRPAVRPTA